MIYRTIEPAAAVSFYVPARRVRRGRSEHYATGAIVGQIHHSKACLRIFGTDLIPDEISELLRCVPTVAQATGEVIHFPSGRKRVVRCGNWRLEAETAEPEDINGQVRSILSKIEAAPSVWKDLVQKFNVDMFCGLFMQESNEGFSLAPDVMVLLGERGIVIDFDVYVEDRDDAVSTQA